ncbi:hypothetical protein Psyaliredsea_20570 [Psychrobacter alimentarius]
MSIKNTVGWPLKFSRQSLKTINSYITTLRAYLGNRVTKTSNRQNTSINEAVDIRELEFRKAPINWIPAAILIATPIAAVIITPWYLMTHQVSAPVWGIFAAFMVWTGMSITAGYHRLLSHQAYKAHPIVRNFLLLGATFAVQGSAFDWASSHRDHHRYVDDPFGDPYSVKRGFFFSHMGWMLRNYPSRKMDFKNIPDLTKDKVLQIQHKYYGIWVLVTNVSLVAALGWLLGDVWGSLVIVGLLRLVLTHHFTFLSTRFAICLVHVPIPILIVDVTTFSSLYSHGAKAIIITITSFNTTIVMASNGGNMIRLNG